MNARSKVACLECGQPVGQTQRNDKKFCCEAHRHAFINRRKNRGQQVMDFLMTMRFDRETAKEIGAWSIVCRMLSNWHTEDVEAGRASNLPVREHLERQVHHVAVQGRVSRKVSR